MGGKQMNRLATTPQPPYYAVIFTSERTEGDNGYDKMGQKMVELATQQPGFLGIESVRDASGIGITVSYWASLDAIKQWKDHSLHQIAQQKGKTDWYQSYGLRVCSVERDYFFEL
jgi:heme-degrading monooxygenase HmoA